MGDTDPKTVTAEESLRAFYEAELSPEAKARREARPDPASVTDDQVQDATDKADGKDDGLAALPSTDIGNVLAALKDGRLTGPMGTLCLFYAVTRDMFVKGDGHGTAAEHIEAAGVLGADLIGLAKLVIAALPK